LFHPTYKNRARQPAINAESTDDFLAPVTSLSTRSVVVFVFVFVVAGGVVVVVVVGAQKLFSALHCSTVAVPAAAFDAEGISGKDALTFSSSFSRNAFFPVVAFQNPFESRGRVFLRQ